MTLQQPGLDLHPVGVARTPYPEKFSVPRQPGLVTCDQSYIDLQGPSNRPESIRGLEQFSHLWLIWHLHLSKAKANITTVRPPRLGGNQKLGVFASRSPFRPNPLGLSVVKLAGMEQVGEQCRLHISGADLVDRTPILDIKPYVPYSDAVADAEAGFAQSAPATLPVCFSESAAEAVENRRNRHPHLQQLIREVLAQNPQPAYHSDGRIYGTALLDINIKWQINGSVCQVLAIEPR